MEGASGVDGGNCPVIAAKFAPEHVSGFIRHPVYDATITVATHQSSAEPPSSGERTNDLLKPAAKTTTTTTTESSSSTTNNDGNDFARSTSTSERYDVESGVITITAG